MPQFLDKSVKYGSRGLLGRFPFLGGQIFDKSVFVWYTRYNTIETENFIRSHKAITKLAKDFEIRRYIRPVFVNSCCNCLAAVVCSSGQVERGRVEEKQDRVTIHYEDIIVSVQQQRALRKL